MHHAHTLIHLVKDEVGLRSLRVADEDPSLLAILKLADVDQLLDEGSTSEALEIADYRLGLVPNLVWHLAFESLAW